MKLFDSYLLVRRTQIQILKIRFKNENEPHQKQLTTVQQAPVLGQHATSLKSFGRSQTLPITWDSCITDNIRTCKTNM